MIGLLVAVLRIVEVALLVRIVLGYVPIPRLKPVEMMVRAATTPLIELVRVRMKQPASPESATWILLIVIELIRLAISLVFG